MENKKRLIDANALREVLKNEECDCEVFPWAVDNAPTVDAVEVVRCCNCEYHDHDGAIGHCNRWDKWTKMSDFCSHGERKEKRE